MQQKLHIGTLLKIWRTQGEKIGLRDAARIIGVSYSTLSRIERGMNMDGKTMAHVLTFLLSSSLAKRKLQ